MKRKGVLIYVSTAFALLLIVALGWVIYGKLTRAGLQVTAHVSRPDGEEVPAGTARFYLLDEDMMRLALVKEGEPTALQEQVFRENPKLRSLAGLMFARRREAYSLGPEVSDFMEQSRRLWQSHVKAMTETDAMGRAIFRDLVPGDYWLMGRAATPQGGVAFWNLFISIRGGETSINLSPANSLQCSACK